MALADLKVIDSAEPASQEAESAAEAAVVIEEVETGFDKLEDANQKTEKKEVDKVVAKVDELEGAIITIAKVETNDALEKDAPDEP